MRLLLITLGFLSAATYAQAYYPLGVEQTSLKDVVEITHPEHEQIYFGDLSGFPHTYEIRSLKPFDLYLEIRIPDIEDLPDNVSGIIVREKEFGGVEEIARLRASDAAWNRLYEEDTNDWYRVGGVFEEQVSAGVYRIEFSTPDNIEKYVFTIGRGEPREPLGYFEKVQRLFALKVFFEKSVFSTLTSSLVYIPTIVLVLIIIATVFVRRRRSTDVV
jgi:hypothetical protein